MRVVSEKSVPLFEVEAIMKKRQKEGEALSYEQQNTLDYAEKFGAKISAEKYKELEKELEGLGFLSERQVAKLCDVLPRKDDEVKAVLTQEKSEITADQEKEVAKVLKKYAKK
ncbi:MAG: DNA-directed RNA polymerase subunit F [Candidatus Micrarchaeia archaeon]|jgi:DNA-directed RNA polymerase subunit F